MAEDRDYEATCRKCGHKWDVKMPPERADVFRSGKAGQGQLCPKCGAPPSYTTLVEKEELTSGDLSLDEGGKLAKKPDDALLDAEGKPFAIGESAIAEDPPAPAGDSKKT